MFLLPFHVASLSTHTVGRDIVGRLSAQPERVRALAAECAAAGSPCVVLGTCHRVELYWWGDATLAPTFLAWSSEHTGGLPASSIETRDADLAVRHLFSVAAGLNSPRFGEQEILVQLRRAWTSAREAGLTTPKLDAVLQQSILAARHIRRQSGLSTGQGSLGEAAVHSLTATLGDVRAWPGKRVAVIGSGAAAESALLALKRVRPASLTLLSGTDARAEKLARTHDISWVPWASHIAQLADSDVVVFATRSAHPVVRQGDVDAIMRDRALRTERLAGADAGHRAIWLDLGVPANVAEDVAHEALVLRALDALAEDAPPADQSAVVSLARHALQRELARFASDLQRRSLAERWAAIENEAHAVARRTVREGELAQSHVLESDLDAAASRVARRVTYLVRREFADAPGARAATRAEWRRSD